MAKKNSMSATTKKTNSTGSTAPFREYEKFIAELVESLIKFHGSDYKQLKIQHDAKIKGISGVERQIDVYWEFEFAGAHYCNAIQAKRWKNKVNLGAIDTLYSVISDLPGTVKGWVITTKGFQSGAVEYAQKHGIELYYLRELTQIERVRLGLVPVTLEAFWLSINAISFFVREAPERSVIKEALHSISKGTAELTDGVDSQLLSDFLDDSRQQLKNNVTDLQLDDYGWNVQCNTGEGISLFAPESGRSIPILGIDVTWGVLRMAPTMTLGDAVTHIFTKVTGEIGYFVDSQMKITKFGDNMELTSPAIDTQPFRDRTTKTNVHFRLRDI